MDYSITAKPSQIRRQQHQQPEQPPFERALALIKSKDYQQAIEILEGLAYDNNTEAQSKLGDMYCYGTGVGKDIELAKKYYRQAANAGDEMCREKLSALTSNHTSDHKVTTQHSTINSTDAQRQRQLRLERPNTTTTNPQPPIDPFKEEFDEAGKLWKEGRCEAAREKLEELAKYKYPKALFELGNLHHFLWENNHADSMKDLEVALHYFTEAAAHGHAESCQRICSMLDLDSTLTKDFTKRIVAKLEDTFRKSGKNKNAANCELLGDLYHRYLDNHFADFTKASTCFGNYVQAKNWYEAAKELGSKNADKKLKAVEDDLKVPMALQMMNSHIEQERKQGNNSVIEWGQRSERYKWDKNLDTPGNYQDLYDSGLETLKKLANDNNAQAQYHLGIMHRDGIGYVEQSLELAANCFEKAIQNGYPDAKALFNQTCFELGNMYYKKYQDSTFDMGGNWDKALTWYQKAPTAKTNYGLAVMFLGKGDGDQAANYFENIAKNNSPTITYSITDKKVIDDIFALGQDYLNKWTNKKANTATGFRLLQLAATAGHVEAQKILPK